MTMSMDLNKQQKILDNRVTCYLCHHGKPEPEFRPGSERTEKKPETAR